MLERSSFLLNIELSSNDKKTECTANKLTVLITAFGCVTFATVIWLYKKAAIGGAQSMAVLFLSCSSI